MKQSQENSIYLMWIQNFYIEECGVAKLEELHLMSKADCEKLFLSFHIVCKNTNKIMHIYIYIM